MVLYPILDTYINTHGYAAVVLNPKASRWSYSLVFHCRAACFLPHNAFCSRHFFDLLFSSSNPSSWYIYTSSLTSPCSQTVSTLQFCFQVFSSRDQQYWINRFLPCHRGECIRVVDAWSLSKALSNQTRLKLNNLLTWIALDLVNHL